MKDKKRWGIELFILLFSVTISVAVLPCGIINAHGLFGEIIASTVIEEESSNHLESRFLEKAKQIKGVNIYNIWFVILASIICMVFNEYVYRLPREETIVTLRIRMDN